MNPDTRNVLKTMTGKLFGTTGVRKVYGTEFDLEMALRLGKAVGTYLGKGTVLLARDTRTTGQIVAHALTAGVISTGVNVVEAGIIPTPTLAFVTKILSLTAGMMVTASHNPPEYTGVKLWAKDSMGFTPEAEEEIERIFDSGKFTVAQWDSIGSVSSIDNAADLHIEALLKRCDVDAIRAINYRIIVDPGNGAACVLTPYLVQKLGCNIITLNGQLDGHFPGRRSEPDEESLGNLIAMVRDTNADLGIAHDGDSDRVVFVTETGEVVRGDRTIALFAKETMKESSSKTIVTTVDSSKVLDETVASAGGKTERTPVGDIQVAIKVKELGAAHGGEACGVFLFPEVHLAPEPFLAVCKILELMAKTHRSFGALVGEVPVYPLKKTKLSIANDMKPTVMRSLSDRLPQAFTDVKEIVTVDGLGIALEKGWVLVRPSGTEPVIRITCEAPTEELVSDILEKTKKVVEEVIDGL